MWAWEMWAGILALAFYRSKPKEKHKYMIHRVQWGGRGNKQVALEKKIHC